MFFLIFFYIFALNEYGMKNTFNINKKLLSKLLEFCLFNGIQNEDEIDKEINRILQIGFNVVKYGNTPFTEYHTEDEGIKKVEEPPKRKVGRPRKIKEEEKIEVTEEPKQQVKVEPKRKVKIVKK